MPPEIQQYLDLNESVKFAVNSRRHISSGTALLGFFFVFIWLGITSAVGYGLVLNPFLNSLAGKDTMLYVNNMPETVGPGNLSTLMLPVIVIGIFFVIGIAGLLALTYSYFSAGGWFVGTDKRLIHLRKSRLRSISWDQFTGNITTSGDVNKGNIVLDLRKAPEPSLGERIESQIDTLPGVRRRSRLHIIARESISIIGVPNVFDLEKICRSRIETFKLQKS